MASLKSEDDQARFASVVLPHLADAYALARWLTGNRADAEDVVQEACLRAFRGIAGFAGVNARAWLLTIVRHAAYTWLGKNRSAALLVVDDLESIAQQQNVQNATWIFLKELYEPGQPGVIRFKTAQLMGLEQE